VKKTNGDQSYKSYRRRHTRITGYTGRKLGHRRIAGHTGGERSHTDRWTYRRGTVTHGSLDIPEGKGHTRIAGNTGGIREIWCMGKHSLHAMIMWHRSYTSRKSTQFGCNLCPETPFLLSFLSPSTSKIGNFIPGVKCLFHG
jgi:hypothetical protein